MSGPTKNGPAPTQRLKPISQCWEQSRKNHKLTSQFKLTHLCNPIRRVSCSGSKSWARAWQLSAPQIENSDCFWKKNKLSGEQQGRVARRLTLRLLRHFIRTCEMRNIFAIEYKFQVCKTCSCKKSVALPEHDSSGFGCSCLLAPGLNNLKELIFVKRT